ncbi:glycosyltransferase involved in cell wall biosynthesis [Algoriphagus boseongensis]|uniref:Glycosyltransferase involved in cell wall biosynthesis n=1 Tax=Algoriphagus boseongensis TaxID=1442587 RepID=A0A4R6T9R7_9BACT|nr:glycosyltransferase [Algoriphagus boseongensis]TDQ18979.1 glycosyltransferase involved in cell wall biosynthesis [Algoriphagus boseongensis]
MNSKANTIPVLIASTLKPIQDVRAYEKLALSLGETNKYSLNIIGFSSKKPQQKEEIRFFSSMSHFQSTWDRLLAQWRFCKVLFSVRPKLVISCTYEYLPIASFFKAILGYRLVYDVQENYKKNLDLNPNLSSKKKEKLSKIIGWAESTSKVDLFILAEKCYKKEMPEKKPFMILENKFQGEIKRIDPIQFQKASGYAFSITGTLTPEFGIEEGITWFIEIQKSFPQSKLKICGHVPIKDFQERIEKLVQDNPRIYLSIGPSPVPHSEILKTLQNSEFSMLPYRVIPGIQEKMPTKLFECAALGIPVLITKNPIWERFLEPFEGGFSVDFSKPESWLLDFKLALCKTYFSTPAPESVLWKSEKAHFQRAIQELLS